MNRLSISRLVLVFATAPVPLLGCTPPGGDGGDGDDETFGTDDGDDDGNNDNPGCEPANMDSGGDDQGDYGECAECGEDIGLKRLMARPVAELCIECKADQELLERRGD